MFHRHYIVRGSGGGHSILIIIIVTKYKIPYAVQCPVSVCVGGGEGCKGSLAWQATDGALFAPDTQPISQRFFGAHGEISGLAEEGR